jgi:hypothetical protein
MINNKRMKKIYQKKIITIATIVIVPTKQKLTKVTMNNRKGSKEMMSNRRTKKTMRNMMVAN